MRRILILTISVVSIIAVPFFVSAESIAQRLAGKILLQVEDHGEAWYIHPDNFQRYYLRDGAAAYELMRFFSLGISDADLATIPDVADTSEMLSTSSVCTGNSLANRVNGRILLQVEQNGEAWYIDTTKCKRIYMADGAAAYDIMRFLGLGITNLDLLTIPVANDSATPPGGVIPSDPPEDPYVDPVLNDGYDATRQSLFNRMNQERIGYGVPALNLVQSLSTAAQAQADDMTSRNYFAFVTPEGKEVSDWVEESGYTAQRIAENLAQTNGEVSSLVSTWQIQSNSSYLNVIDADYKDVGIGVGSYNGIPIYTVIFAQSLADYFAEHTADLHNLSSVRSLMLDRLNFERANNGLSPLSLNSMLNNAAQGHTDDMLARSYYGHDTPEGKTPHERITEAGYVGQKTAENIAKGQFSVEQVMDDWMNSPSHRANILDADFIEVGFGLSFGQNGNGYEVLWAQEFGKHL